jgi:prepilin-type N-terminal cleavage/methylation domain-containing protein
MKKAHGFTLIELVLVVALLLTVAVLSTSFYSRFLVQNDVSNTVDRLVNSLRKAQINSMMGKQNDTWGVSYASKKITLFKGATLGINPSFNEVFTVNNAITVSGLNEIVFSSPNGTPSTAATITISGNNSSKTIKVNAQGVVSK